jgi:hypothetical protein
LKALEKEIQDIKSTSKISNDAPSPVEPSSAGVTPVVQHVVIPGASRISVQSAVAGWAGLQLAFQPQTLDGIEVQPEVTRDLLQRYFISCDL